MTIRHGYVAKSRISVGKNCHIVPDRNHPCDVEQSECHLMGIWGVGGCGNGQNCGGATILA
eukprot:11830080-Karenia_brevis.AAC.1